MPIVCYQISMKLSILLITLLFPVICSGQSYLHPVPGTPIFGGKCQVCVELGIRSVVHVGGSMTTAMYCGGIWYNEDGFVQYPEPCNTVTTFYSCSKGHSFALTE